MPTDDAPPPDDPPALLGGPPAYPEGPPTWPPPMADVRAALTIAAADGSWGRYHGPHVPTLERDLAAFFGSPFALTCASGTLAVEAALRVAGVKPGHEVIMAAYDYEANFLAVHALGATPVLIDVLPGNWNLDPNWLTAAISNKSKVILCTHLHGGLVPMPAVMEFAEAHDLLVIEDAAQCPGASVAGRKAGTWGHVGTLSFGGSKLLTAGRGGALLLSDSRYHQRAKLWLNRGIQQWAALSEMQAAAVRPQLVRLPRRTVWRGLFARLLAAKLERGGVPGLKAFDPATPPDVPAFFKLGFKYDPDAFGLPRELFVAAMRAEGIAFDKGFRALHPGRSPSRFRAVGDLAEATRAGERCVKLHHPVLLGRTADATLIAQTVDRIYRNADKLRSAPPPPYRPSSPSLA